MMSPHPLRINAVNSAPENGRGRYVLYWMIAARRTRWNFALDHAIARAKQLDKSLLIVEPLRCDYPWASDRLHAFVMQGMVDNAAACARAGVTYVSYVEPKLGAGRGLLAALAKQAALVVTDEFPCFFLPRMVAAAGRALDVRLEQVDGNGILPLRATGKAHSTAAAFRWHWQKEIHPHLLLMPSATPLSRLPEPLKGAELPRGVASKWPSAATLAQLPIDHSVAPVIYRGGSVAATTVLGEFIDDKLARYDERNQPQQAVTSGLSPYLHFGHISTHEVISLVWRSAGWDPSRVVGAKANGSRDGWWGLPPAANAFMDQILTWRELGYAFTFHRPDDYDTYESLPTWARTSLDEHASDQRNYIYSLAELEAAQTHDPLWNAAQTQLVREGRIHNYLRMLWGKKILEWTPSPRVALDVLIQLNNKYSVDGRNPNSYSGIFWTLGRFDRPWAPIRKTFGCIRYMSSDNTARKVKVKDYIATYSD